MYLYVWANRPQFHELRTLGYQYCPYQVHWQNRTPGLPGGLFCVLQMNLMVRSIKPRHGFSWQWADCNEDCGRGIISSHPLLMFIHVTNWSNSLSSSNFRYKLYYSTNFKSDVCTYNVYVCKYQHAIILYRGTQGISNDLGHFWLGYIRIMPNPGTLAIEWSDRIKRSKKKKVFRFLEISTSANLNIIAVPWVQL